MKKILMLCAALLLIPAAAIAHERRETGDLQVVVGWTEEPAYTGFKNSVQIVLTQGGKPIVDLGKDDLLVTVEFGNEKSQPLTLTPAHGSPGEYRAEVIPTRPGQYIFHFVGTVKGQPFDQKFTSGEKFDSPRGPNEVSFPAKDPTQGELAQRIDELESRLEKRALASSEKSDQARSLGIGAAAGAAFAILLALIFRRRKSV